MVLLPLAASDARIALISGVAAVLGALVGGAVTGFVALRAEDKRQTFSRELEQQRRADDQDKERAAVRGASRVMRTYLLNGRTLAAVTIARREWWREGFADFAPRPGLEEERLVASRMSPNGWGLVSVAFLSIANLREAGVAGIAGNQVPDDALLRQIWNGIQDGLVALAEVTEIDESFDAEELPGEPRLDVRAPNAPTPTPDGQPPSDS